MVSEQTQLSVIANLHHDNHSEPDQGLMEVLETSSDAIDMYLHHLPDKLSYDN